MFIHLGVSLQNGPARSVESKRMVLEVRPTAKETSVEQAVELLWYGLPNPTDSWKRY